MLRQQMLIFKMTSTPCRSNSKEISHRASASRTTSNGCLLVRLIRTALAVSALLGQPALSFTIPRVSIKTKQTETSLSSPVSSLQRNFSTTKLSLKAGSDDDSKLMASLNSRLRELQDRETKLPLVVLDCMLPRQILRIQVRNALFLELVRDRLQKENPLIGMLGMARLQNGQQVHLSHGVEVEVLEEELEVLDDKGGGLNLSLRATRRFRIQGEVDNAKEGWTEARVEFLDSSAQEEAEADHVRSRAIMRSKELTSPNMNTPNNLSLVDRWIELAKENERTSGQIEKLLDDLGDIPPPEQPSERAFWVGALVNPLPAMGVALEIRPALLTAKTSEERIEVALDGILRSIKHMDGSARLW